MSPKKKFKWSSHNPAILTALELVLPNIIVELGVGNFSTPLFLQSSAKKIIHIENDSQWLGAMQDQYTVADRNEFRLHYIADNVGKSTPLSSLPQHTVDQCKQYYQELQQEVSNFDLGSKLLFVDHYSCLRGMSINSLAHSFDAIVYHDAETPEVYDYQTIDADLSDVFDRWILKTSSSWTGFMIRKNLVSVEVLEETMRKHCETFGHDYGKSLDEFIFELL